MTKRTFRTLLMSAGRVGSIFKAQRPTTATMRSPSLLILSNWLSCK